MCVCVCVYVCVHSPPVVTGTFPPSLIRFFTDPNRNGEERSVDVSTPGLAPPPALLLAAVVLVAPNPVRSVALPAVFALWGNVPVPRLAVVLLAALALVPVLMRSVPPPVVAIALLAALAAVAGPVAVAVPARTMLVVATAPVPRPAVLMRSVPPPAVAIALLAVTVAPMAVPGVLAVSVS